MLLSWDEHNLEREKEKDGEWKEEGEQEETTRWRKRMVSGGKRGEQEETTRRRRDLQ